MIIYDKIGRCDNCLKGNTRILVTRNKDMIQGQICINCFNKLKI